jgi:hypothetical protein
MHVAVVPCRTSRVRLDTLHIFVNKRFIVERKELARKPLLIRRRIGLPLRALFWDERRSCESNAVLPEKVSFVGTARHSCRE